MYIPKALSQLPQLASQFKLSPTITPIVLLCCLQELTQPFPHKLIALLFEYARGSITLCWYREKEGKLQCFDSWLIWSEIYKVVKRWNCLPHCIESKICFCYLISDWRRKYFAYVSQMKELYISPTHTHSLNCLITFRILDNVWGWKSTCIISTWMWVWSGQQFKGTVDYE